MEGKWVRMMQTRKTLLQVSKENRDQQISIIKKKQTKENEHVRTLSKQPKKKENIQNSRTTLYPFTVNLMPGNDQ